MSPETSPKRRRGAPLGNTNNLKHGFYARKFKASLRSQPAAVPTPLVDLASEIHVLRLVIATLQTACLDPQNQPPEPALVNALVNAAAQVARLLNLQRLFTSGGDDLTAFVASLFSASNAGLPCLLPFSAPEPPPAAESPLSVPTESGSGGEVGFPAPEPPPAAESPLSVPTERGSGGEVISKP
jgi:hypothetical protein